VVKLPKQLKFADRMGIRFVAHHWPRRSRQMAWSPSKTCKGALQETTPRAQAAETIRKMLAAVAFFVIK